MSELIDRAEAVERLLALTVYKSKRELIEAVEKSVSNENGWAGGVAECIDEIEDMPAASPWHRVEDELPKGPGEYIVAYHPCWWEDVEESVTKVGIYNFRGKSAWAKKKFQRVTHLMEKPEPPKEDE